jgi:hypothetical protein
MKITKIISILFFLLVFIPLNSYSQQEYNKHKIYDVKNECWIESKVHAGRLVYGKQRIPYSRITRGIDKIDFIVHEYLPF